MSATGAVATVLGLTALMLWRKAFSASALRLGAACATAALLLMARAALPEVPARERALGALVLSLGYAHLIGAALGRRDAGAATRGRALFGVLAALSPPLWALMIRGRPLVVLALLAISVWHTVENDRAMASRGAVGGVLPALSRSLGRQLEVLALTSAVLAYAVYCLPAVERALLPGPAAWLPALCICLGAGAALARPKARMAGLAAAGGGLALAAQPPLLPALDFAECFAAATGYHLFAFAAWSWPRSAALPCSPGASLSRSRSGSLSRSRSGSLSRSRSGSLSRTVWLGLHGLALGVGALLHGCAPLEPLGRIVFSPSLYLYFSLLHVVSTCRRRVRTSGPEPW